MRGTREAHPAKPTRFSKHTSSLPGADGSARQGIAWGTRIAASIVGLSVVLTAGSALPQGNIDAGKTPAQMFSDVCTNCHRRPQDLKRGASVGFLRQHYMPGSQEAAAMASYLAGLPNDPRAKDRGGKEKEGGREKEREKDREKSAAKAPLPQQQANDKGKAPAKGKRPAELAKGPPESPAETAPETAATPVQPEPEAPPIPKLEPFEE